MLAQHVEKRTWLTFFLPKPGKTQHADDLGSAGAIHDLAAEDSPFCPETHTVDLPALFGSDHGLGKFVKCDLDSCRSALFLAEDRVEKLVCEDLVLPVALRDFREVREIRLDRVPRFP
jgi:hypothetical protein